MDKVAVASQPKIAYGSTLPHAVLTLSELKSNLRCFKPAPGGWRSGISGHYSLPMVVDDGVTPDRPFLLQFKGRSSFGISFFEPKFGSVDKEPKKEEDEKDKEKKEKKEKKARQKPATIAFDSKSGDVQELDVILNAILDTVMKPHLRTVKQYLAPGNENVVCIRRNAARASSGRVQRNLRLTCYPGKVQLQNEMGKLVAMQDMMQKEGNYTAVMEIPAIDASLEKEIITYGFVFYAQMLKQDKEVIRVPLTWREEQEPTDEQAQEQSKTWIPPSETTYLQILKEAVKEEEKEKKKEKKKEKESKKRKKVEEEQE